MIVQSHPGAGARRGGKGPALRSSSCPGPRLEERREPALQAWVRPSPEGGGTAPRCRPVDPRGPPRPPFSAGYSAGPYVLWKAPLWLERSARPWACGVGRWNRQVGRPRGGARRPHNTFGFICWVNTVACWILCFGTDFRWCDTGDRFLSCTLWVSQITSICSKNKHRLLVRVVKCPVSSGLGTVGGGGRNGAVYTLNSWWHGSVFLCHRIYLHRR